MNRAALVGSPCQSARPHGRGTLPPSPTAEGPRILCGLPADFIWLGIDPRHLDLTAAQRRKYIRSNLLLCGDCAMELAHEFAWHIRDGKARLERLDVQPLRITCRQCHAATKISWDTDAPAMNPGMIQYCPRCGHNQIAIIDPEADYWDIMERAFYPMPLMLLKMLYEEWPRNDRRYRRFRDYVEDQIHQFEATQTFEAAEAADR